MKHYFTLSLLLLSGTYIAASDIQMIARDATGYHVSPDGETFIPVKPYDIDSTLRDIPMDKLPELAKVASIRAVKLDNGDYKLRTHVHGPGGGPWGAWAGAWAGKLAVHGAAVGAATAASAVCPVASPAIWYWYAVSVPAVVEPASTVAAVGCGIAGAVATGPV